MGNFAKQLCCTKQSLHRLVPIVLCKLAHVANERLLREVKRANEVLKAGAFPGTLQSIVLLLLFLLPSILVHADWKITRLCVCDVCKYR